MQKPVGKNYALKYFNSSGKLEHSAVGERSQRQISEYPPSLSIILRNLDLTGNI